MAKTIRAFIAVSLQQEISDQLSRVISSLDCLGFKCLRTVNPDGVHITLKFLGDVPENSIDTIRMTISQVVEPKQPFTVKIGGFGAYPNESALRVLWLGVTGPDALLDIHADIEKALVPLGFPRDRHHWSPHLTLARIRDGTTKAERRMAWKGLISLESISWNMMVSTVSLIRSQFTSEGPVYRTIQAVDLAGSNALS